MLLTPKEIEELDRKEAELKIAFDEVMRSRDLLATLIARTQARQGREPSDEEMAQDKVLRDQIDAALNDENLRIVQEAFEHEPSDDF